MFRFRMKTNVYSDGQNQSHILINSSEDVKQALNHKSWRVRMAAVYSPHFGPDNVEQASKDEAWSVREAVKERGWNV